jgi:hypothetical protein
VCTLELVQSEGMFVERKNSKMLSWRARKRDK